jgi:hypothetical protein
LNIYLLHTGSVHSAQVFITRELARTALANQVNQISPNAVTITRNEPDLFEFTVAWNQASVCWKVEEKNVICVPEEI